MLDLKIKDRLESDRAFEILLSAALDQDDKLRWYTNVNVLSSNFIVYITLVFCPMMSYNNSIDNNTP